MEMEEIDIEDYQIVVRRHQPEGVALIIASCYGAILMVGLIGNVWVAWMVGLVLFFGHGAKVPKSIQFYIFVLCLSDILILLAMSLLLADMLIGEWIFGQFACIVYMSIDAMNKFAAPLVLAFLSGSCYASICRPMYEKAVVSLSKAIIAVLMAFIIVFVLLTPVFRYSGVHHFPMEIDNDTRTAYVLVKCGFKPPPSIGLAFNFYACFLGFIVPTIGFVYFYVSVLIFLKRHEQEAMSGATGRATLWKVGKVVFGLIGVYLSCWTPYWVAIWVTYYMKNAPESPGNYYVIIAILFVHMLPYISCSAYPIIYTGMNRGIKDAHARIMVTVRQRRRLRSMTEEAASKLETMRFSLSGAAARTRMSTDSTTAVSTVQMQNSLSNHHLDKPLLGYMRCPTVDRDDETTTMVTVAGASSCGEALTRKPSRGEAEELRNEETTTGWETIL